MIYSIIILNMYIFSRNIFLKIMMHDTIYTYSFKTNIFCFTNPYNNRNALRIFRFIIFAAEQLFGCSVGSTMRCDTVFSCF